MSSNKKQYNPNYKNSGSRKRKANRPNDKSLPRNNSGAASQSMITHIPSVSKLPIVTLDSMIPSRLCTIFKYESTGIINNAGLPSASVSFNCNGLYDVDPRLASTAIPGFVEWMNFYERYRVLKVTARTQMYSREAMLAVPLIMVNAWHSTGFGLNSFTLVNYSNPFAYSEVVGSTNLIKSRETTHWAHEIVGDSGECYEDNNFVGTGSTNPNTGFYYTVGCSCPIPLTALNQGIFYRTQFEFLTELFERKTLAN